MNQVMEIIELEVTPISTDTIDMVEKEFLPFVENMLQESEINYFFTSGQIKISPPKAFPEKGALYIVVYFFSKAAYETWISFWKEVLILKLKDKWGIRTRSKTQKNI